MQADVKWLRFVVPLDVGYFVLFDGVSDEEFFAVYSLMQDTRDGTSDLETKLREARTQVDALRNRVHREPALAGQLRDAALAFEAAERQLDLAYAKHGPLSRIVRVLEDQRRARVH